MIQLLAPLSLLAPAEESVDFEFTLALEPSCRARSTWRASCDCTSCGPWALGSSSRKGRVYWLSEGFTNFYTRRPLLRAGLTEPADYVHSMNGALRAYLTSPVRDAPNERIRANERPLEIGFDFDRPSAEHVVRGAREGSRAHAAGLRDGQPLRGWSVHWYDHRQAVEVDGAERTLAYLPQGQPCALPQFALVRAAGCDRRPRRY